MSFQTPILLLIFNRPECTQLAIERIRIVSPTRLYIAADGPRDHRTGEAEKVKAARQIALKEIPDCEIRTLLRERNIGCRQAVKEAIDWFFENEQEGIILEDDCLPDISFFRFCHELLAYYRHNEQVGIISGNNFQFGELPMAESYYFSEYPHVWGWATWRRVWSLYDCDKRFWVESEKSGLLKKKFRMYRLRLYWKMIFEDVYANRIDTWDYQLVLSLWSNHLLSVLPSKNIVTNIGFGLNATHTRNKNKLADMKATSMKFPLQHPQAVIRNVFADQNYENKFLNKWSTVFKLMVKRTIRRINFNLY